MSKTESCRDCEYLDRKTDHIWRCRSPQLLKIRFAGMACAFERDDAPDPDRSHQDGTGMCGPQALNFKRREAY